MKLRAAVGVGILLACLLAITCTRQTPGNPSSNNQAKSNSAENIPPNPTPAPPAGEEQQRQPLAPAEPQTTQPTAPETMTPAAVETPTATPPPPVVLPAGTVITVRSTSAIGAKTAQAGQTFQAVVAQAVTRHGKTAIPAGAAVTGKIVQAHQGGKIQGESNLGLQLTSIRVQGVSHPISTEPLVQQQKGKGGRTAKMGVGGGAAGAVIGGIAGGGKGAAIGALAGGGAGVAGSAFTGNKELTIPAESVLQFKLAQPVQLSSLPASNSANEDNQ
jgi:hypothetical protein